MALLMLYKELRVPRSSAMAFLTLRSSGFHGSPYAKELSNGSPYAKELRVPWLSLC